MQDLYLPQHDNEEDSNPDGDAMDSTSSSVRKDALLKELEEIESGMRNRTPERPGSHPSQTRPSIGEAGAVRDLGPQAQRIGAKERPVLQEGPHGSAQRDDRGPHDEESLLGMELDLTREAYVRPLETSLSTIKEKLKERNNQKRDLLNELMEARKLVWEYKQESTKAKQAVKNLLQTASVSGVSCADAGVDRELPDVDMAGMEEQGKGKGKGDGAGLFKGGVGGSTGSGASSPSSGAGKKQFASTLSPRGGGKGGLMGKPGSKDASGLELEKLTVRQYIDLQDKELRKSVSKLAEARMVAHAYLRMVEERTEIIRSMEMELERRGKKEALSRHPCGEVMIFGGNAMVGAGGMPGNGPAAAGGVAVPGTGGMHGPVGNPLARNRPNPAGLIPLREDGDEEAKEEESLRGMMTSDEHTASSSSNTAPPGHPPIDDFALMQVSSMSVALESLFLKHAFHRLSENSSSSSSSSIPGKAATAIQASARRFLLLKKNGGSRASFFEHKHKEKMKYQALKSLCSGVSKLSDALEERSFSLAANDLDFGRLSGALSSEEAEGLRLAILGRTLHHFKGYLGVLVGCELIQAQLRVFQCRKAMNRLQMQKLAEFSCRSKSDEEKLAEKFEEVEQLLDKKERRKLMEEADRRAEMREAAAGSGDLPVESAGLSASLGRRKPDVIPALDLSAALGGGVDLAALAGGGGGSEVAAVGGSKPKPLGSHSRPNSRSSTKTGLSRSDGFIKASSTPLSQTLNSTALSTLESRPEGADQGGRKDNSLSVVPPNAFVENTKAFFSQHKTVPYQEALDPSGSSAVSTRPRQNRERVRHGSPAPLNRTAPGSMSSSASRNQQVKNTYVNPLVNRNPGPNQNLRTRSGQQPMDLKSFYLNQARGVSAGGDGALPQRVINNFFSQAEAETGIRKRFGRILDGVAADRIGGADAESSPVGTGSLENAGDGKIGFGNGPLPPVRPRGAKRGAAGNVFTVGGATTILEGQGGERSRKKMISSGTGQHHHHHYHVILGADGARPNTAPSAPKITF